MFCDRCGSPLQPDFIVCPKCGKPIRTHSGQAIPPARLERHLRTLGIIWIVISSLWLLPSFGLFTMSHMGPVMFPEHVFGRMLFPQVMWGLGAGFLLIAAAGICVGYGLMQREPWARVAAIVLGILAIFHPPLGTLLGIYTLWVLLSNDAAAYDQIARPR